MLAGLISGERTATAILTERAGSWNRSALAAVATADGDGWKLSGKAHHVLHGGAADDLVVIATIDAQPAIFLVNSADHGVIVEPEPVLDRTRRWPLSSSPAPQPCGSAVTARSTT
ncbi:putative acyl-CoA dehydrogenase [Mycobacterium xenopi 4042]|uniref:Putative acyl-CoA dehydrogenase n=1 Tax=Mycobacterium xenopi 4042 TaxID=1299334 RepID=X7ZWP1_MYCXE|nr:putative acyl-CoA dehydrogenase [Mycobacterium xenopi 4042]